MESSDACSLPATSCRQGMLTGPWVGQGTIEAAGVAKGRMGRKVAWQRWFGTGGNMECVVCFLCCRLQGTCLTADGIDRWHAAPDGSSCVTLIYLRLKICLPLNVAISSLHSSAAVSTTVKLLLALLPCCGNKAESKQASSCDADVLFYYLIENIAMQDTS